MDVQVNKDYIKRMRVKGERNLPDTAVSDVNFGSALSELTSLPLLSFAFIDSSFAEESVLLFWYVDYIKQGIPCMICDNNLLQCIHFFVLEAHSIELRRQFI